ncbi:NarK family nitrate/nitrite MFS transporter [Photobacterium kishitanii]|uniref:NarK family nitrate/nitrite MFS transporter n=1 Tax=Photobacterium kishitanii TaxID=318456 RepID=UPI000D15DE89|nr:NarK family nitrate/nitrite MFS transporter [Photobacterium kishitanii]PSU24147.1 MFS transporter [Photobacterium kishitanii]
MSNYIKFNLFSFRGKMKILHISWLAFFITFMVWFNFAPLLQAVKTSLGLTTEQIKTLLILNVALTIPARVVVGMLTDRYGPRIVYSLLLVLCAIPCFVFAFSTTFMQAAIARFALGFIGAGFVIGIRLVSEWFPHHELGTAEGIYGGWGNFGSAAAAFTLPTLALWFGGDEGWRYAMAVTGGLSVIFGVIFYFTVTDTPKGATYYKSKHIGAMEVTSRGDLWLLIIMKIPMYAAMALLVWKLSSPAIGMLRADISYGIYIGLVGFYLFDIKQLWQANRKILIKPVPTIHRYSFRQVAVLNVLYFTTFGSELAVVSMLPLFFADIFTLTPVMAGVVASSYAFMNLVSRPGGGWLSDRFGRKSTLLILTAGLAIGYLIMANISASWPLWVAVATAMICSFFVQSGEGAVFAVVPLIKRRMTGQIAGMTGAYGNVGAVCYLTILSLVEYSTFFVIIALTAILGFVALLALKEPSGKMAEINDDGSVTLIDVG